MGAMRSLVLAGGLLWLGFGGCGGGGDGGGGGNNERIIAVFPVSYDVAAVSTGDPAPFCFANLSCADLAVNDQLGVALTLLTQGNVQPGEGPIRHVDANADAAFLAQALTDNQLDPIAAGFMVALGQFPGCIGDDETDLVLLEARPVSAVDLFGFEITAFSLRVDSFQRTATRLMMTGRVQIYGKTATP